MKPRQESSRPTEEDSLIWHCVLVRFPFVTGIPWASVWQTAQQSDRRDAELMYRIEVCRQYEREHPEDFADFEGEGWVHCMVDVALEGRPIGFAGSDITYCA